MGIKTVQDTSLTSVANAIRVKAEISGTLEFPDEFVSAIQNISTGITPSGTKTITENGTYDVTNFASADVNVSGGGGGASVPPSEVNFYDYDGTVVNAYTATEFANLSAMPANPTHDGLTAQGWNWSLADAQAYVAKYGRLNIGQMYVTTSGDTEIDIQLGIGRNKPYLGCCPNGTVEIDWGDGSAHDTLTGTSTGSSGLKYIQHIYPDTGEMFTIKLHMESGVFAFNGNTNSSTGSQILSNGTTGESDGQRAYQSSVKAVRLGTNVIAIPYAAFSYCCSLASITVPENVTALAPYAFQYCYGLSSITIPRGVTRIYNNAFQYCYGLSHVVIPKGVTRVDASAFDGCYSLQSLTIPDKVTTIGAYVAQDCRSLADVTIPESLTTLVANMFIYCHSLASIVIPKSVTSIQTNTLRYCESLAKIVFMRTTPPTAGSNAFANLPSDIVVYVPNGTLSAYQAASNYSSISSKMVEMSA